MTTNNQELQKRSQPTSIKMVLSNESIQNRIKEVLGARAPQFCSSIVSLVNASDALATAEPHSVVAACMTAALLNLPINKDLGFAHIIPYAGVAQFQMGYKGFVQLAMRTGQYKHLNACPVHEGELISYDKLSGELVLDPNHEGDGKVIGWAAYMELVNGFKHALYWSDEKVQKHAEKFSQAVKKKKTDSPWFTNRDVMCLKTVLKALLSKWGILSVELERALQEDQGIKRTIDAATEFIDNTPVPIATPKALPADNSVATGADPAYSDTPKGARRGRKQAVEAASEPERVARTEPPAYTSKPADGAPTHSLNEQMAELVNRATPDDLKACKSATGAKDMDPATIRWLPEIDKQMIVSMLKKFESKRK